MVIRTPDHRLRVFVSSTLGELAGERRAVSRAISALRLTPVMFESGARPHPPRDLYRAYLAQSDIFIGLYWQRYGWIGPGMEISGLEDEFELSRSLPRLLYVKSPAPDRERRLTELLARIEEEASASYRTFRTPGELGRLVRTDLAAMLSERFAAPLSPAPAACTLPGDTAAFTGRSEQVREIPAAAMNTAESGSVVVVHAIDGMPGVGKTALAVHVGHLVADRFPDRQLFVDLHGHTPGHKPTKPADVLAVLLAADGVDARYLPADLDGRAAMWRDRMAGKRVLLIFDNAASSDQVTPLLPGTAGCLVLVTSRRYLGDLPSAVVEVPLDTLPPGDARAMFLNLAPRAAGEPAKVAELVALCGHLPLAISLLARLFTRHPSWTMSDLIGETMARQLIVAAENRTVATAFELSYQYLTTGRQRFFRHLGLHPGTDIDPYAAAALSGLPLDQAAGHLDGLQGDRLLAEPVPRRYRMHDLIRQFAHNLAATDPEDERERAVMRLLDYYQHTAEAADVQLARHTLPTPALRVAGPAAMPSLAGGNQAQAWMTAERSNLVACLAYADGHDRPARVVSLTAAMASHLRSVGPWPQASALHAAAASAAQRCGDWRGQANALTNLGTARRLTGDLLGAAAALGQARDICRDLGDHLGEANALYYLGEVRRLADDPPGAAAALIQALEIYRDLGDRLGEANALSTLGAVRQLTGDYPGATAALEQALGIYRDIRYHPGKPGALNTLGAVLIVTDDYTGATAVLEQALETAQDVGDRLGQAKARLNLGIVRQMSGDYPGATAALEQALEISRNIGDRLGDANILLNLGIVQQTTGDYPDATAAFAQALSIYRNIGNRLGQANALYSLAVLRQATGDYPGATAEFAQALNIYDDIGDRLGQANAVRGLGAVRQLTGDYPGATAALEKALSIYRDIGNRGGEAGALSYLGTVQYLTGNYPAAATALELALDIFHDIGDRLGEAEALNQTAAMHLTRGDPQQARAYYRRAGEAAHAIGSQLEEARALEGTGKCSRMLHDTTTADDALRQALKIYRRIGTADASRLAADMDGPQPAG